MPSPEGSVSLCRSGSSSQHGLEQVTPIHRPQASITGISFERRLSNHSGHSSSTELRLSVALMTLFQSIMNVVSRKSHMSFSLALRIYSPRTRVYSCCAMHQLSNLTPGCVTTLPRTTTGHICLLRQSL